ncbi:helix-turn-helix domain-containing protein [Dyadobacter sp. CY356]|uniref:AraC family transcriptional regulator n=1 Tax=Dyadobacter sp. CY356 TaxID=2906442 RepID=UPI001F2EE76F|nr:helix-turn-helix domain-containing protein [Dyadobacter sp. CY356]MCF0054367.1 helix-turn-helix domain-containing protein [Dyadobacter sp. CY356]
MQILPSPPLAHIVKHFLIIENEQISNVGLRLFSDGNTGMVFNFGTPLLHLKNGGSISEFLPTTFVYGQLDTYQNIVSTGNIKLLIVVFHPFGISTLLKIPAVELKNMILDLETFYTSETQNLAEQIFNLSNIFFKIQLVENFLITKLSENDRNNQLPFQAISLIHQYHGNLSVMQLTDTLQVSERKLQRTFEEHVGLTPKRYSGMIRVQYFLKLLRKNSEIPKTGLVYDAGFFDQAHLIREMRNISGITPGQYLDQPNLLAANFLQIP